MRCLRKKQSRLLEDIKSIKSLPVNHISINSQTFFGHLIFIDLTVVFWYALTSNGSFSGSIRLRLLTVHHLARNYLMLQLSSEWNDKLVHELNRRKSQMVLVTFTDFPPSSYRLHAQITNQTLPGLYLFAFWPTNSGWHDYTIFQLKLWSIRKHVHVGRKK